MAPQLLRVASQPLAMAATTIAHPAVRGIRRPRTLEGLRHSRNFPRQNGTTMRLRSVRALSSLKSQELLEEGKALVSAGNRMGAIRAFEESLGEEPTAAQRQEALYSIMVCHASFGDVELAQITLREALQAGLVLDDALQRSDFLQFTASKQAQIQLRKFAEIYSKSVEKAAGVAAVPGSTRTPESGNAQKKKKSVQELLGTKDVSGMTSTTLTGIDTSVAGIVVRVAALVLFLVVFGIGAYFIGIDYILEVPGLDE